MLFDLINEVENLLKRRYKRIHSQNSSAEYNNESVLYCYHMSGSADIFLNNERQVVMRLFYHDTLEKDCIAVNVLHKRIDNVIDFNYDDIYTIENEEVNFIYDSEIDLFSNLNKILDFAEHLSSNILF